MFNTHHKRNNFIILLILIFINLELISQERCGTIKITRERERNYHVFKKIEEM